MKTETTKDRISFGDCLRLGICPRCINRPLFQDKWVCQPCYKHFASLGDGMPSDGRMRAAKAAKSRKRSRKAFAVAATS